LSGTVGGGGISSNVEVVAAVAEAEALVIRTTCAGGAPWLDIERHAKIPPVATTSRMATTAYFALLDWGTPGTVDGGPLEGELIWGRDPAGSESRRPEYRAAQ
jgi:hypothetical protein